MERMKSLYKRGVAISLGAVLLTAAIPAVGQQLYKVLDQWAVGGEGGWDYLAADPSAHKLYLTHGTRLEVLDTTTGKSVGAITGFKGSNTVVAFDRQTLEKLASIPAGSNPDGAAFEPTTSTVWAFNGRSSNATVIDAKTRTVVATIPLPGKPEFPQVDGNGTVYVNIEDKNEIVRLDAKTKQATATWPLAGCDSPSGLAIDVAGHRLFSVCDGKKMAITDTISGRSLGTATIGDGPDAAGYDAVHQLAFSSNGDGTLTVVDVGKPGYPVVATVTTEKGARTMAFDAGNGRVYLVTAQLGPRPAATPENPRPRPTVIAGSFHVIVVGR